VVSAEYFFGAKSTRGLSGRWRAFEVAADNREAAHGKGARCLPTSMVWSSRPMGDNTPPTTTRTITTGGAAWSGGNDP
jgi:hypothetical protein